jgi:hypothetical protein
MQVIIQQMAAVLEVLAFAKTSVEINTWISLSVPAQSGR